ncbi:hypothetical protein Hanom_Chr12g01158721 [Helianthus anomalus]
MMIKKRRFRCRWRDKGRGRVFHVPCASQYSYLLVVRNFVNDYMQLPCSHHHLPQTCDKVPFVVAASPFIIQRLDNWFIHPTWLFA